MMQLTEEQKKIAYYDGAQIVVAGAGTGKTETLAQHILYLLLEKRYALNEIVAITFTEKAAAEMRERVYKTLSAKVLLSQSESEKAYINKLRNNFPAQNRITTIDGFNAGLLSSYPEYSPLPHDYQIVDKYTSSLLEVETRRLFLEELEKDPEQWQVFLTLSDQIDLNGIFVRLEEIADLPLEDIQEMQQDISREEFIERFESLAGCYLNDLWNNYVCSVPEDIDAEIRQTLVDSVAADTLLTKTGTFRTAKLKKDPALAEVAERWSRENTNFYKTWKEESRKLIAEGKSWDDICDYEWELFQMLRQLAQLAALYKAKRQERIRQSGKVRFEDVANAVLEMLHRQPALLEEVRHSIKHILLDEFQDTNAAQWELVRLLKGENNVMLVGDPKQSIYRFRGGDVTLFEKVRVAEFSAEQQRELTFSQRACPALIEFYNEAFSQVLWTKENRPVYEAAHQDLHIPPHKQNVTEGGVTWIESKYQDDEEESEDPVKALAAFLRCLQEDARYIAACQEDGIPDTEPKVLLMPQYESIATLIANGQSGAVGVLCATHDYKNRCESMLRKYGVQFTSYHGRGFYDSMPVLLAINLARFFYNNADNLALTGVLRSPLCGISDVVLARLSSNNSLLWEAIRNQNTPAQLGEKDTALLHRIYSMLERWQRAARVLPFSEVMEKVWHESSLPFYFGLENDGDQQQENFSKLIDILRQVERNSEYGLAETIAFLETLREESADETQAELPDDGSIQLLTLHASKGLGFPMTILAQMSKRVRAGSHLVRVGELGDPPQKYFSLSSLNANSPKRPAYIWNALKFQDTLHMIAELKRELYVACTRAKEHLVVFPTELSQSVWGEWLGPAKHKHVLRRYSLAELEAMVERLPGENMPSNILSITDVEAPLDGTILPAELSVSQLLNYVFPETEREQDIPDEDEEDQIPVNAKSRGSLIHRLLEWDDKSTFTAIRNLMTQEHLPQTEAKDIEALAHSTHAALQQMPVLHESALHEMPFSLSHIELKGYFAEKTTSSELADWLQQDQAQHWCNGIIDYLAPLQEGGYAILDFKTHWNPAVQKSQATRERIQMQLQIYAIAAAKLGLNVKKLYALRIYGMSGEIALEEFALDRVDNKM